MGKKQKQDKRHVENPQHYEVFVSGLPYETTEDDVKKFFDFATDTMVKLPKYQDTGRCLGYGHVVFSSEEDFKQALAKNGQHIGTRYVNVQAAKGRKQVEPPQNKSVPVGCKVLFVKNLPYEITEQQLTKEFGSCGIVKDVRMIKNWQTKKFKGFVYIDYKDTGSVKKAIAKYHGKNFKGRNLICDAVTTDMKKGFKRYPKQEDQEEQENMKEQEQYDEENDQDNE